ncbi:MAG: BatD family protein [Paludibacter sp.]
MKSKILLSLFIFTTFVVFADEPVRFMASAPSTVVLDKPFQLVFTVNATAKDLRVPDFSNFEVLAGPFESHSQSIQYVNGKSSSTVSVSYTYTLQAQKTGTFTIPSASITVEGKKVTSNGLSIKVLPADATPPASKSQGNQSGGGQASISADNIFIKTEVSKTNVYEQEAILVTYKLYTLADVIQCNPKGSPDFNGFLKQDFDQQQGNKQMALENYNGRNYGTFVLYKTLLYPQHSGVIQIDKWPFEAVVRVQNRQAVRSIFDDFFDSYTNVSKLISAPAVKIVVNALPTANKPASFNGTVGHFTLNSSITTTQVKANEAVTLKLNITGSGNMKLIKNPTIKFPDGFELYDPKVTNNFKTSAAGVSGTKSIDYLFIPRHSGNFDIPSTEISYFDTQDKAYKTLRTPAYNLQVSKGDGNEAPVVSGGTYVDKQDVKQLGKDIRFIQTGKFEISKEEEPIVGTVMSWLFYLIPLLISLVLFIFFRKQAKENADVLLVKNKKANKLAQKRLKVAQKLLREGNKDAFYEEVMKATWTYLSDKLSIPVASLTKDRVEDELNRYKVDSAITGQFVNILNTCEFARFAPNTGQQEMGNLYEDTIQVISSLEEKFKK